MSADDELEKLRQDIYQRKLKQNARRAKAGKKPMHKALKAPKPIRVKGAPPGLPMPESGDIKDSALSFDEWKSCGYAVKKGETFDHYDILGIPQFLMTQVRKINPAWEKYRSRK